MQTRKLMDIKSEQESWSDISMLLGLITTENASWPGLMMELVLKTDIRQQSNKLWLLALSLTGILDFGLGVGVPNTQLQ